MKIDPSELLLAVRLVVDSECAAKAAGLLGDEQTRMVDGLPTREAVHQLLPTLRARSANAARTSTRIYGLDEIVAALTAMDSDALVLGYGFISPTAAGNFYLTADGGNVLGATLVDR